MLAATLLAAGCSNPDEPAQPPPEDQQTPPDSADDAAAGERRSPDASDEEPDQSAEVDAVVATTTLWSGGEQVELEARVGPLVREGDLALLTMSMDVISPTGEVSIPTRVLGDLMSNPTQVRLVDPVQMVAAEPALRPDDNDRLQPMAVMAERLAHRATAEGDPLGWLGLYGAPADGTISVLMPEVGLISDVPVVDGPMAGVPSVSEFLEEYYDGASVDDVVTRAFPIESHRERYDLPVGTQVYQEQATVTVATDVLFDIDSADLSDGANAALQAAADEFAAVEGGDLLIVGHTDDVLDEAHNQALSEDRAEAVYERLQDLADLAVFDSVDTQGRAFHDPLAPNDSEDNRALNRRVELHFTPPPEPPDPSDSAADLPGTEGAEGTFTESVEVVSETGGNTRRAHLHIESVERIGHLLVGRITVEQIEGIGNDGGGPLAWPMASVLGGPRGSSGLQPYAQFTTDGPTLLAGGYRIYPLDYYVTSPEGDDDDATLTPLVDRFFTTTFDPGESATATILWPALNVDTLTVEVPSESAHSGLWGTIGLEPWRITDVPVE